MENIDKKGHYFDRGASFRPYEPQLIWLVWIDNLQSGRMIVCRVQWTSDQPGLVHKIALGNGNLDKPFLSNDISCRERAADTMASTSREDSWKTDRREDNLSRRK